MSKVYDPIMNMLVEEKVKVKDAMKFNYKIEASAYKDGVIKIKVSNDYWDTSDYAFWDGKKIYSYSSVAADYVKNALKDVNVDPRTIKPGYKKRFANYGSGKNMDVARVESQVIEEKNGYKLGKVDTGHGPRIVLAFPGESLENPHMYLGRLSQENLTKGKQMLEKFAKTKDTKDAKVLGHVKEAAKILGISENDLEDRGYEKGYELVGHKKTGAILAKKNIRSGKMIVYKERMTKDVKDAIPSNLSKSKIVNSKDRVDREMNRMLGNSGQYVTERTGIRNYIYKNKISKKIIGYYNDMSGDLFYDPSVMVRE